MATSAYGRKLNPHCRLHDPLGAKGVRQSVVVTNNPIDQNQQLLVWFPNLGAHNVIAPQDRAVGFHSLADIDRRQPNSGPERWPRNREENDD